MGGASSPGIPGSPYRRDQQTCIDFCHITNNIIQLHTVNQLSFMMTLFHDLPEMNWFKAINFCDQALSTSVFLLQIYIWQILVPARNIRDNEAVANLTNFLERE